MSMKNKKVQRQGEGKARQATGPQATAGSWRRYPWLASAAAGGPELQTLATERPSLHTQWLQHNLAPAACQETGMAEGQGSSESLGRDRGGVHCEGKWGLWELRAL